MKKKPSYPQRIALRVLADGGWLTEGTPGASTPRLWDREGCLYSLVPRQCLTGMLRRGWVAYEPAFSRGVPTYIATPAGRAVIGGARP